MFVQSFLIDYVSPLCKREKEYITNFNGESNKCTSNSVHIYKLVQDRRIELKWEQDGLRFQEFILF